LDANLIKEDIKNGAPKPSALHKVQKHQNDHLFCAGEPESIKL